MEANSRFDRKIENHFAGAYEIVEGCTGQSPGDVRDATIFIVDTLDICHAGAQAVFGKTVMPEVSLGVFDRVMKVLEGQHLAARRTRWEQEARENMDRMPPSSIVGELRKEESSSPRSLKDFI